MSGSGSGSVAVVVRARFLLVVGWFVDVAEVGNDVSPTPDAELVVMIVGLALPLVVAVTDAFTVASAGAGVGTPAADFD